MSALLDKVTKEALSLPINDRVSLDDQVDSDFNKEKLRVVS